LHIESTQGFLEVINVFARRYQVVVHQDPEAIEAEIARPSHRHIVWFEGIWVVFGNYAIVHEVLECLRLAQIAETEFSDEIREV
jgi:hypothetical protein